MVIGGTAATILSQNFYIFIQNILNIIKNFSFLIQQAAPKEFWCKRPQHYSQTNVDEWRNISRSIDNCHILNIDWSTWNTNDTSKVSN